MGFPAARLGDSTVHGPPLLGVGAVTVLIGGKPAWRVGDTHTCPLINAPPPVGPGTPHVTGITMPPGALVVLIGGKPAARMGDIVTEPAALVPLPPPNPIISGCMTVLIGGPSPPLVQNPDGSWTATYGPGIQINGDPAFIAKAWYGLDRINETPSGKKLINSLNTSGKTTTIISTIGGNSYSPGSQTIKYNPERTVIGDGSEPYMTRPPEIGLGHELCHASHDLNGGLTKGADGSVSRQNEERRTVGLPAGHGSPDYSKEPFSENSLRKEMGEPQRPRYGPNLGDW